MIRIRPNPHNAVCNQNATRHDRKVIITPTRNGPIPGANCVPLRKKPIAAPRAVYMSEEFMLDCTGV
jgi:hypothetical protein